MLPRSDELLVIFQIHPQTRKRNLPGDTVVERKLPRDRLYFGFTFPITAAGLHLPSLELSRIALDFCEDNVAMETNVRRVIATLV